MSPSKSFRPGTLPKTSTKSIRIQGSNQSGKTGSYKIAKQIPRKAPRGK